MKQFSIARRATLLLSVALLTACASGVKLDDVDGKVGASTDYSSEPWNDPKSPLRSEEHTSELQSH